MEPADADCIRDAAKTLGWIHDHLRLEDIKQIWKKGVIRLHPDKVEAATEAATEEAKAAFNRWQEAWELLRDEMSAGRQFVSDDWDVCDGVYVFSRQPPPPAPPPAPPAAASKREQKEPAAESASKKQKTADAAGGAAAGARDTFWQENVAFEAERVRKQADREQLRAQMLHDMKVAAMEAMDAAKQELEDQRNHAALQASVEQLLADVQQDLRRYVAAEVLDAELAQGRRDHYWRFWIDELRSVGIAPSDVVYFAQRMASKEDMFDVVWYVPYKTVIVISDSSDEDKQPRSASGPSAPRAPGNAPGPSAQGGSAQQHRRSSRNPVPTDRYRPIEDPRRRDPV